MLKNIYSVRYSYENVCLDIVCPERKESICGEQKRWNDTVDVKMKVLIIPFRVRKKYPTFAKRTFFFKDRSFVSIKLLKSENPTNN